MQKSPYKNLDQGAIHQLRQALRCVWLWCALQVRQVSFNGRRPRRRHRSPPWYNRRQCIPRDPHACASSHTQKKLNQIVRSQIVNAVARRPLVKRLRVTWKRSLMLTSQIFVRHCGWSDSMWSDYRSRGTMIGHFAQRWALASVRRFICRLFSLLYNWICDGLQKKVDRIRMFRIPIRTCTRIVRSRYALRQVACDNWNSRD